MCIVNRIKKAKKVYFFPRETHDPIDDLGESKRHLSESLYGKMEKTVTGQLCHQ